MAKQNVLQKPRKLYEYTGRMRKNNRLTFRGTRSWARVRGRLTPQLWKTVKKGGIAIDQYYFEFRKAYGPRRSRWLTINDIVCVARSHGFEVDSIWIKPTTESRQRKKHWNELQRSTDE